MMKVYFSLLALVLLAALGAEAALMREPNAKSPTQTNKCKSSIYNLHLKINKHYRMPDTCGRMYCDKSYMITYETCGSVSVDPPLKLVQNMKLPYPDCCPTPVLDEDFKDSE